MVEDHPLDYASFEGVIADCNYGAGHVIVWDSGIYSPDEESILSFDDREEAQMRMRRALEKGKLSFTLRGRKLRGSWTLARTSRSPSDRLLINHRDKDVDTDRDVLQDERSVQSGLTLSDLKSGRLPDPSGDTVVGQITGIDKVHSTSKNTPFPSRLRPMLARIVDRPFSHPNWLFEPKLDGYRILGFLQRGKATLRSRNDKELTKSLPLIVGELESQPVKELVLDGEIVALDSHGVPDFGLLQRSLNLKRNRIDRLSKTATIVFYIFDLVYANGANLQLLPLMERKRLLKQAIIPGEYVRHVEYVEEDGESFFEAALQLRLEGMVAKRSDSTYEPGVRSASWLKVKAVRD